MERKYLDDSYTKKFTAEIINISEKGGDFYIELDQTYFTPDSDIYEGDLGLIGDIPVKSVVEKNNTVLHVLETKPIKIHRVKCALDWSRRYSFMQSYLGYMLISSLGAKKFNCSVDKFKLSHKNSFVQFNKRLSTEECLELSKEISEVIRENQTIDILYPSKSELKKLGLKNVAKKPGSKLRVLSIDSICSIQSDLPALASTIELSTIIVDSVDSNKEYTKVHFMCGFNSINSLESTFESMKQLTSKLSCSSTDIISEIDTMKAQIKILRSENTNLKNIVSDYEVKSLIDNAESVGDYSVIKLIYEDATPKYIELLVNKVTSTPNIIVLIGYKHLEKVLMTFNCSKNIKNMSMSSLLKDAITLIDGNGGGSAFSAKGGGKSFNNLPSALDYAFKKIVSAVE